MAIFEIGNNRTRGYARQVFRLQPVHKPGTGSPSNLQRPLHSVTLRAPKTSLKKTWRKLNDPLDYPHRRFSALVRPCKISHENHHLPSLNSQAQPMPQVKSEFVMSRIGNPLFALDHLNSGASGRLSFNSSKSCLNICSASARSSGWKCATTESISRYFNERTRSRNLSSRSALSASLISGIAALLAAFSSSFSFFLQGMQIPPVALAVVGKISAPHLGQGMRSMVMRPNLYVIGKISSILDIRRVTRKSVSLTFCQSWGDVRTPDVEGQPTKECAVIVVSGIPA